MCAIISLKVWIDINCAQTVDLKKKIAFCLFSTDLHRFIHILIRFFFGKKPYFLRPKISVFLRKYFFFGKKPYFLRPKISVFLRKYFFFTKNHFEKIVLVFVSNAKGLAVNIMLKIRQKKILKNFGRFRPIFLGSNVTYEKKG